jgi:glycosyltransferase involved in cell wall biosynthesis
MTEQMPLAPLVDRTRRSEDTIETQTKAQIRVWMYDPWCRTPWYTAALTRALLRQRMEVRLVCPRYHLEPLYFQDEGLVTRPGPLDISTRGGLGSGRLLKGARLAEYLIDTASLALEATRRPPDILHQQQCVLLEHGYEMELSFLRWCKRRGTRVIHTVHNLLSHGECDFRAAHFAKLYGLSDALVCHSEQTVHDLQALFSVAPERIHVVPHGPLFADGPVRSKEECRAHFGLDLTRQVFLAHGVLRPYKGTDLLLRAWAKLMARWSGGERPLLLIAGHGDESEVRALRQEAAALRLDDGVVRMDLRYSAAQEVPFYFGAADVLLYPYRKITTSGALLTGLSYCKPIIASDLLPFRDYLRQGHNALLVPAEDVQALEGALDALCGRGELYQGLRDGSSKNGILPTPWSEIGARTAAIYAAVLA